MKQKVIKPILFLTVGFLFFIVFIQSKAPIHQSRNSIGDEKPEIHFDRKKARLVEVEKSLGPRLLENSGMISWRGLFWLHNDSGGKPELYAYDTSENKVTQTVKVSNAKNIDWEDLTQDETFIYIGDFGNNLGNRKDLSIYKVKKTDIPVNRDVSITAEAINFSYPDQKEFRIQNRKHDFDCEAVIAFGDSLYLLSKNWQNKHTKLYRLPKKSGTYEAEIKDIFFSNGLVTGADFSKENSTLILVGYNNYVPFVYFFYNIKGSSFLSSENQRFDFYLKNGLQTEAICFGDGDEIYISSERNKYSANKLFFLKTNLQYK